MVWHSTLHSRSLVCAITAPDLGACQGLSAARARAARRAGARAPRVYSRSGPHAVAGCPCAAPVALRAAAGSDSGIWDICACPHYGTSRARLGEASSAARRVLYCIATDGPPAPSSGKHTHGFTSHSVLDGTGEATLHQTCLPNLRGRAYVRIEQRGDTASPLLHVHDVAVPAVSALR